MTKDIDDLIRRQQARELADATLEKAAGPRKHDGGGTYLATSFKQRDDLPVLASIRKMSDKVVRNLAELGLHEPVSLRMLPGRWWKVHIDAAEVGEFQEYGCAYVTRILSSERLAKIGFEVVDGPFAAWANREVTQAILEVNPGKYWDARIWSQPPLPEEIDPPKPTGSDNAYSSKELLTALDAGHDIQVFGGPFDTEDDAHYALDLRWESPE